MPNNILRQKFIVDITRQNTDLDAFSHNSTAGRFNALLFPITLYTN